jgi:WD40 repeat protein
LASALIQGDITLDQILDRILQACSEERFLLLIDQFEELYTLCPEQAVQENFLDLLMDIIGTASGLQKSPYALLLTMRADFMGDALSYRPFADALQHGTLMLGPMTRVELREAIEKPAEAQGAAFEEGLVERILDDVGREPGNLPLLEFALTLLWEKISSGWLRHAIYERIGGVQGALARHAEQVYAEFDEDSRGKVQRVFIQLVRPGEGAEDTRRVATRTEIRDQNWLLVQHLADRRLVVTGLDDTGNEIVEVVHEALISNWERLQGWIEAERAFRTWQERLRGAIRQWQASGGDEGVLLRGTPLAEAEAWLTEKGHYLSQPELDFIRASIQQREHRRTQQERSRRRVIAGLGVGLIITLLLAIFAGWQWRSAQQEQAKAELERDQNRIALSRSLASQAELLLDQELDLATLLSIEAVNIDPSVEARSSLLAVLAEEPRLAMILHGQREDVLAVAISPDGRLVAAGDAAGGLYLYGIPNTDPKISPDQTRQLTGHAERISSLAFSPDGRLLVSGGYDDSIYLWDTATGEQVSKPFFQHSDNIWALAMSPDRETLVSGGADGQILQWDLGSGLAASGQPRVRPLAAGLGLVSSLTFSPDGEILAAGMGDGSVVLWDMTASKPIGEPLTGHDRLVRALVFSPDGSVLASAGDDSRIVLWNTQRDSASFLHQLGEPLAAHEDWVTDLAFSPDAGLLTSAEKDGLVYLWNLEGIREVGGRRVPRKLLELKNPVWSLAYSPDGRWLVTGGEEDASVWDLSQLHPWLLCLENIQTGFQG